MFPWKISGKLLKKKLNKSLTYGVIYDIVSINNINNQKGLEIMKKDKELFNEMQNAFSKAILSENEKIDSRYIEKQMKKSYLKLLSENTNKIQ